MLLCFWIEIFFCVADALLRLFFFLLFLWHFLILVQTSVFVACFFFFWLLVVGFFLFWNTFHFFFFHLKLSFSFLKGEKVSNLRRRPKASPIVFFYYSKKNSFIQIDPVSRFVVRFFLFWLDSCAADFGWRLWWINHQYLVLRTINHIFSCCCCCCCWWMKTCATNILSLAGFLKIRKKAKKNEHLSLAIHRRPAAV